MEVLPREIWVEVFKYMDFISVLNVGTLSTTLSSAIYREYFHYLVKHLFDEDFQLDNITQSPSVYRLLAYNTHVATFNQEYCNVLFMNNPLYNVFLLNYRCCVTLQEGLGEDADVLERDPNLRLLKINWTKHRKNSVGKLCHVLMRLIAIFPEFIDVTSCMNEYTSFGHGRGAVGPSMELYFPQCIVDEQREIEYTGLFVSQWDSRSANMYAFVVFILENYFYIWTGQIDNIIRDNEATLGFCKCEYNIKFSDMKDQITPTVLTFLEQVKYSWYRTYYGFSAAPSLYETNLEHKSFYTRNMCSSFLRLNFVNTSLRAFKLRSDLENKFIDVSEKIASKCENQLKMQQFCDKKELLNFLHKLPCAFLKKHTCCCSVQQRKPIQQLHCNENALNKGAVSEKFSKHSRSQTNVLKVSVLRCLHRLMNWLFIQECLEYIDDLTCHRNLCQRCSYITSGTNHDNLSIHHLPPKVWPLHLLVMAEHVLPVLGKLLQLDIMMWHKDLSNEIPQNVRRFISELLDETDFIYTGNTYPPVCVSVEIPSQVSALKAFHIHVPLPADQGEE